MRCPTLMALLAGVMLYLVMGALVFSALEAPQEKLEHEKLLRIQGAFLRNFSCVNETGLSELIMHVVSAVGAGVDAGSSSSNFTSRWDLASAFFFSGTIITTIGFGNLSPRTRFGQLFCVCFALVGIPMFGFLLAGVSDHMGTLLRKAVANIETLFLKRRVSPTSVRVISAVLSILIGCLIFLAAPTVVFQEVEEWSFLEAIYFVVITLTTVGFGDFVPGGRRKGDLLFKPLVLLWIVFGLAYFASILTMIGNWLKVLSKKTRAEMEELRAHATDWSQNIQNMSMDFRIPNPLDLNDPFLLQRRRWKRSERRRVRRGAQATLANRSRRTLSENGHLPNHWVNRSHSLSLLEFGPAERLPLPRARPRLPGTAASPVPRADAALPLRSEVRSFARSLARSLSLPVAQSASELDEGPARAPGAGSGSGSRLDSRSDLSSSSSSSSLHPCTYQPGSTGRASPPPPVWPRLPRSSSSSSTPDCQLLAFFGENLAYIDESSDTLSDRFQPAMAATGSQERKSRPCKPRRRSMRRELPLKSSPLLDWRRNYSADMQPPSNPPTPPPASPLRD
ncbi:potassium channel subfamily K member 2 [Aplochiton taeniatus]